jgi:hypothetical protein
MEMTQSSSGIFIDVPLPDAGNGGLAQDGYLVQSAISQDGSQSKFILYSNEVFRKVSTIFFYLPTVLSFDQSAMRGVALASLLQGTVSSSKIPTRLRIPTIL